MSTPPGTPSVASQALAEQPVLSIRAVIPIDQLGAVMGTRIEALADYLRQTGAQPAGPFLVRYHTFGATDTDMETGVPVAAPVAGAGPIRGGVLPGGRPSVPGTLAPIRGSGRRTPAWLPGCRPRAGPVFRLANLFL